MPGHHRDEQIIIKRYTNEAYFTLLCFTLISLHGIAMPQGLYFTAVIFYFFLLSFFFFDA